MTIEDWLWRKKPKSKDKNRSVIRNARYQTQTFSIQTNLNLVSPSNARWDHTWTSARITSVCPWVYVYVSIARRPKDACCWCRCCLTAPPRRVGTTYCPQRDNKVLITCCEVTEWWNDCSVGWKLIAATAPTAALPINIVRRVLVFMSSCSRNAAAADKRCLVIARVTWKLSRWVVDCVTDPIKRMVARL